MAFDGADNDSYEIPPAVYDVGVGWDPTPEVERLLFLARQAGRSPRSALELGCGTGRLVRALHKRGLDAWGIELSSAYAEFATLSGVPNMHVGDMTRFDLPHRFDLIFTSANTIRHALDDGNFARIWRRIADHLEPDGVFVADLELGREHAAKQVGRPMCWSNARGDELVEVSWLVETISQTPTPRAMIKYEMTARGGACSGTWAAQFPLRIDEGAGFVAAAHAGGGLHLRAIHEMRDPYLPEITPDHAQGRCLVALSLPPSK